MCVRADGQAFTDNLAWVAWYGIPVLAFQCLLTVFACHWSLAIAAVLRYRTVSISNLRGASYVLCRPAPHCGQAEIRPLSFLSTTDSAEAVEFVFQQIVLRFDPARGVFAPRRFPDRLQLADYCGLRGAAAGVTSPQELKRLQDVYGKNEYVYEKHVCGKVCLNTTSMRHTPRTCVFWGRNDVSGLRFLRLSFGICSKSMPRLPSLSFKCFVWSCGVWMSIGTTLC
jgi:hypothetical protein